MTDNRCAAFVVLTSLWTLSRADADVSCVFMQSCVLPCSFQYDNDLVVHWIHTGENVHVHSYYYDQDQFENQDQRYQSRTSLFKEQISRGNASLQLTGVRVQDQGSYKCYTSNIRERTESFIRLQVDAPVSEIHIGQVGNRITCSSEGIYPEPELTWSTDPPSSSKSTTTVHQTEEQLYNISSSLILPDPVPDVIYSCRINTRTNTRRTTLRKPVFISDSDSKATIHCTDTDTSFSGLIWRFNHSQTILIQTRTHVPGTVSEDWRKHVRSVSESGSLVLQGLSSDQEGTYTCEVNTGETYTTYVSFLRTKAGQVESQEDPTTVRNMIKGAVAVLGFAAVVFIAVHSQKGMAEPTNNKPSNRNQTESQQPDSHTGSDSARP